MGQPKDDFLLFNAEENWMISGVKMPLPTYYPLSVPKLLSRLHSTNVVSLDLVHMFGLSIPYLEELHFSFLNVNLFFLN